jgi:uncharacterized protein
MSLQISAVMLGVEDVARARTFYAEGLGGEVEQDHPGFARLTLGDGSAKLALYPRGAAAEDAGVSPEGSGFRGSSLHFITDSRETVDETLRAAAAAGGTVVKEAAPTPWGGYFGYFADPDGHLWKVTTAT